MISDEYLASKKYMELQQKVDKPLFSLVSRSTIKRDCEAGTSLLSLMKSVVVNALEQLYLPSLEKH
jgi:hypothetical protein